MKEILAQGLYPAPLKQGLQLCEEHFDSDPITFFVLTTIISAIINDFWETEQVPKEIYERLEKALSPLILAVWESEGESRRSTLEKLIREFKNISIIWK